MAAAKRKTKAKAKAKTKKAQDQEPINPHPWLGDLASRHGLVPAYRSPDAALAELLEHLQPEKWTDKDVSQHLGYTREEWKSARRALRPLADTPVTGALIELPSGDRIAIDVEATSRVSTLERLDRLGLSFIRWTPATRNADLTEKD